MKRMVAIRFNEPVNMEPIEIDEEVLLNLDVDQAHRLQKARCSDLLLAKFVDTIPLDELEERKLEEKEKNLVINNVILIHCNTSVGLISTELQLASFSQSSVCTPL